MQAGGYLIANAVNLTALIVVVSILSRGAVKSFLKERSKKLSAKKEQAALDFKRAERDYRALYGRLGSLQEEIAEIMKRGELDGEVKGERMLIEAEKVVDRIIEQSMARIDSEMRKKNLEFYRDVIENSLKRATEEIKDSLTIDKDLEISSRFLKKLSKMESTHCE